MSTEDYQRNFQDNPQYPSFSGNLPTLDPDSSTQGDKSEYLKHAVSFQGDAGQFIQPNGGVEMSIQIDPLEQKQETNAFATQTPEQQAKNDIENPKVTPAPTNKPGGHGSDTPGRYTFGNALSPKLWVTPPVAEKVQETPTLGDKKSIWAGKDSIVASVTTDSHGGLIHAKTILTDMLETLIREDKKIEDIRRLWEYLKVNLGDFMRKNLPFYQFEMSEAPVVEKKPLELKVKNTEGTVLTCSIEEKQNRMSGDSPFAVTFSTATQEEQQDQLTQNQQDLKNMMFTFNGDLEKKHEEQPQPKKKVEDSNRKKPQLSLNDIHHHDNHHHHHNHHNHHDHHNHPPNRSRQNSYVSATKFKNLGATPKHHQEVENSLSVNLLAADDHDDAHLLDDNLINQIDKHIDNFIAQLDKKTDWTRLKIILRAKFLAFHGITPKKVRRFLRKITKMVHGVDEISMKIMLKKVDINFVEIPMSSTVKEIASSETSIVNFVRDIAWAPLTYLTIDIINSKANSDFWSETLTQTIISMVAMAIAAVIYHITRNKFAPRELEEDEEPDTKWVTFWKSFFVWLGAGLAIPGWNALENVGVAAGLNLGMSQIGAGYFASLFPGLPEGPIQGVMSIISANTLDGTWHKMRLRTFIKQLLIFGTFGAVPGNIWQLVYQVIVTRLDAYGYVPPWANILVLGLGLATAVYIGNVAFGTGYERIINKSHLLIGLESLSESVHLDPDLIDEAAGHAVSYNGRPGAPRKRSIYILKHEDNHSQLHSRFHSNNNTPKHSPSHSHFHSHAQSHAQSNVQSHRFSHAHSPKSEV